MGKIKVLFLSADPLRQNPLALDEEIRAITAKIQAAEYRNTLELVSAWAVRPDDLHQLFLQHRPHIVHFSGHGSQAEQLILKDRDGRPKPLSKDALIELFDVLKDDIRVVILNACHSKPQAEAIAKVIDCAIGMKTAIGDEAAIIFAAAFYQAIGFGRDVQTAFRMGINPLRLEGIPEENTPELLVREGVSASLVFLLNPQSQPERFGHQDVVLPENETQKMSEIRYPSEAVEIFYSYSREDEKLRDRLETHLSTLKRQGEIAGWHDRKIASGSEWQGQIDKHLNSARVILLLISADFLASDYCYDVEMKRALERHESGEARVIPVILRPCDWKGSPFGKLAALPKDGKPVTKWDSRDDAFQDVAIGIRKVVGELARNP